MALAGEAQAGPSDAAFKQLLDWILRGHSEIDLHEALAQYYPDEKAPDLLARAAAHFQLAGHADPNAIRGFCIEAYRDIFRRALDIADLSTALKALARLELIASR